MTIKSLRPAHFKGIKSLTLDFGGKDATIYAANGVGKTTVCDAVLFAFTGKDSAGVSDFSIKTLDAKGEVAQHGVEHSVELVVESEGREITLRRVWKEKWTNRRGSADKVYDGDESEFYTDGVKRTKQEYDAVIAGLVDGNEIDRTKQG